MLVPCFTVYIRLGYVLLSEGEDADERADWMYCPGAAISGLIRPSRDGPRLLNGEMSPIRSPLL